MQKPLDLQGFFASFCFKSPLLYRLSYRLLTITIVSTARPVDQTR
jgi:hypothetical protein